MSRQSRVYRCGSRLTIGSSSIKICWRGSWIFKTPEQSHGSFQLYRYINTGSRIQLEYIPPGSNQSILEGIMDLQVPQSRAMDPSSYTGTFLQDPGSNQSTFLQGSTRVYWRGSWIFKTPRAEPWILPVERIHSSGSRIQLENAAEPWIFLVIQVHFFRIQDPLPPPPLHIRRRSRRVHVLGFCRDSAVQPGRELRRGAPATTRDINFTTDKQHIEIGLHV